MPSWTTIALRPGTLLRALLALALVVNGALAALAGPSHADGATQSMTMGMSGMDCGMHTAARSAHASHDAGMRAMHLHADQAKPAGCPGHDAGAPACKGGCGCPVSHPCPVIDIPVFALMPAPAGRVLAPLPALRPSAAASRLHRPPIA